MLSDPSLTLFAHFRDRQPASFCFQLHLANGGKRVPRGVKGCRGDPRQDPAIILILQSCSSAAAVRKQLANGISSSVSAFDLLSLCYFAG
ncbi:hypothetical protein TNCV_2003251 [Trichonephila clavipes]|nr:hypothetical protein TNCV_2003251 [Trichonephila clavipes]